MKAVAEAWTTRPAGIHGVIADQAPVSARGVTPHFQAVHGTPAADMVFDLQQAPGCYLHQVTPVHNHSAFQNLAELDVLSRQRLRCRSHRVLRELLKRRVRTVLSGYFFQHRGSRGAQRLFHTVSLFLWTTALLGRGDPPTGFHESIPLRQQLATFPHGSTQGISPLHSV